MLACLAGKLMGGAMAPLSGTSQGGTVHVVAAQVNPGTQMTPLFLSPCLSWHDIFWFWLRSLYCRETSSLELGKWSQKPQAYLNQLSHLGNGAPLLD